MNKNAVQIPQFTPESFVGRQDILDRVTGVLAEIDQAYRSGSPRTIIIRGERGSGKTWLALYLKRRVLPQVEQVEALLLRLFPTQDRLRSSEAPLAGEYEIDAAPPLDTGQVEALCRAVLVWTAGQIKKNVLPNAELQDLSDWVQQGIENITQEKTFVLMIDSAFEADWSFLEALETHLIGPLAAMPRVLIIMTGRGRPFPWTSPYLKNAHDIVLEPFDREELEQQLAAQPGEAKLSLDEILEAGGGYPLANVILAQQDNRAEALDLTLDILLSAAGDEIRHTLREWVEALSVLEGFKDDDVAPLLSAYHAGYPGYEPPDLEDVRTTRTSLVNTQFIQWEGGRFVIDKAVRSLGERYLYHNPQQRETWRRLHARAYELYFNWSRKFVKHQDYYEKKAVHHQQALQGAGYSISNDMRVQ